MPIRRQPDAPPRRAAPRKTRQMPSTAATSRPLDRDQPAHEHHRSRRARHLAAQFQERAGFDRRQEMRVQLDRDVGRAVRRRLDVAAQHVVGEQRQDAAMDRSSGVGVVRAGREAVEPAVVLALAPGRADGGRQEIVVHSRPAGGAGVGNQGGGDGHAGRAPSCRFVNIRNVMAAKWPRRRGAAIGRGKKGRGFAPHPTRGRAPGPHPPVPPRRLQVADIRGLSYLAKVREAASSAFSTPVAPPRRA